MQFGSQRQRSRRVVNRRVRRLGRRLRVVLLPPARMAWLCRRPQPRGVGASAASATAGSAGPGAQLSVSVRRKRPAGDGADEIAAISRVGQLIEDDEPLQALHQEEVAGKGRTDESGTPGKKN